ncbi:vomeronasal type-2 receptor 26-like [Leptodactylus fuscus]|uniref:vomeronasal type-2 receptor 26-like n=1 Tax=Leptodactylus fuscus TaxID=238119 RepID=UPI003F4ECC22
MDSIFTDRLQFPHLYRTVPSHSHLYFAVVQLLTHFGWNWVGILSADDYGSQRGGQDLKTLITDSRLCVEFLYVFSTDQRHFKAREIIVKSSSKVLIVISEFSDFFSFITNYYYYDLQIDKVWIFLSSLNTYDLLKVNEFPELLNGTLNFVVHKGEIGGLREFMYNLTPYGHKEDGLLHVLWQEFFCCHPVVSNTSNTTRFFLLFDYCSGNESLASVPLYLFDVYNFRLTYSIYTAVYMVAYSLHDWLLDNVNGTSVGLSIQERHLQPWKLHRYLKKVHFTLQSGDEIYVKDDGEVPRHLDLQNWIIKPNLSTKEIYNLSDDIQSIDVGTLNISAPEGHQLVINDSQISWHQSFTQTPRSVCSKSCDPGYRKYTESLHVCCYTCVLCSEGKISNQTDADECTRCPEDHYSDDRRVVCLLKTIEFLSYDDGLGMCLTLVSMVGGAVTCAVLGIFWKHQQTPVVKANNQNISYVLLVSLLFSFLCTLLFIGRPMDITCLLRQSVFGILFTVSIACVLAKSFLVVLAFNATKPGSKLQDWVGWRVSISLIVLCLVGQLLISMVWLISSPPFPDYDLQSDKKKMILRCNEGSIAAFYILIAYMGLLSLLSFIVAFLVRKLPASFNEAQLITFSMLLVCSVWIGFIPAYLSTKGKYMVAVEVFAILSSSAGLLGCIFMPKCYIILFTPEMNTRLRIIGKPS